MTEFVRDKSKELKRDSHSITDTHSLTAQKRVSTMTSALVNFRASPEASTSRDILSILSL
jgi:hypothetical protein